MKLLLPLLLAFSLQANEIPKLSLNATAIIRKPADELLLKIGVINMGRTAEEALTENNTKMQEVINNLKSAGLTEEDYETGRFSITPTYTPTPKVIPPDWAPSINGYEVNNTLQIHTDQLTLAGTLIDVANKAGANSITDVRFGLRDSRIYWSEALQAAGNNAVEDAQTLARATGVRLRRVISLCLTSANVNSPRLDACYLAKAVGGAPAPIEPGEVSLTANVSIVYEIE